MYIARLICSDEACADRIVAEADTLEELDALACECGCAYQVLGVPDWVEETAVVVALRHRPRRPVTPPLPEAA
jgi:hypothetical protein